MRLGSDEIEVISKIWHVIGQEEPVEEREAYGLCDGLNQRIEYDTTQSPSNTMETLFHELTHALDFTLSLDLNEYQVQALSAGWMSIFKRNPEFTRAFFQAVLPKCTILTPTT